MPLPAMRLHGAPEPFRGRRFPVAGSCPSFPAGFRLLVPLPPSPVRRFPVTGSLVPFFLHPPPHPSSGFPTACFCLLPSRRFPLRFPARLFFVRPFPLPVLSLRIPSAFFPLRFPGPLLSARSLLPAGLQLLRSIRPLPFVLFRRAIRREQISSRRAVFMRKFRTFAGYTTFYAREAGQTNRRVRHQHHCGAVPELPAHALFHARVRSGDLWCHGGCLCPDPVRAGAALDGYGVGLLPLRHAGRAGRRRCGAG